MRYLVTVAAAALCCSPSSAAVQMFKATGLFLDDSVLSGTVSIDETQGIVTAATLMVAGASTTFTAAYLEPSLNGPNPIYGAYALFAGTNPQFSSYVNLLLPTNLVGYRGGQLFSASMQTSTQSVSGYVPDIAINQPVALVSGSLSAVPEPASWLLAIMGLGAAGAMKRRRMRVRVRYT